MVVEAVRRRIGREYEAKWVWGDGKYPDGVISRRFVFTPRLQPGVWISEPDRNRFKRFPVTSHPRYAGLKLLRE